MSYSTEQANEYCELCGVKEEQRECVHCGALAKVVDCGHNDQPAYISADMHHSGGEYCCKKCWELKEDECNEMNVCAEES